MRVRVAALKRLFSEEKEQRERGKAEGVRRRGGGEAGQSVEAGERA